VVVLSPSFGHFRPGILLASRWSGQIHQIAAQSRLQRQPEPDNLQVLVAVFGSGLLITRLA
jgi:hypothetical protein